MRISADRPTDLNKFSGVKSELSEFNLRHECLPLSDALAQFCLCNTGVLTRLHKQFDYSQIKIGSK